VVGGAAFVSTITATVPVEILIVLSTVWSRRRWWLIAVGAACGSTAGAVALYLAFHHFGWALLLERYPDLAGTRAWSQITGWLSEYGIVALFVLMTIPLPIPKLPALAAAGIYRLPVLEVVAAILLGKLIKYSVYAYVASRFPGWFQALDEHPVAKIK